MSWEETGCCLPACRRNKKTKAEGKKTKWKLGKKAAADYKTKWVAVFVRGNLLFPKGAHQGAGSEPHGARPQAAAHSAQACSSRSGLCHWRGHGFLQKKAPCSMGRGARPHWLLRDTAFLKSCKTNSLGALALPKMARLPTLRHLSHFFFTQGIISNCSLKLQFLKLWVHSSKRAIAISWCAPLSA